MTPGPVPSSVPPPLPPPLPRSAPIPVLPLDYFRPPVGEAEWVVAERCATINEWHHLRRPLISADIPALMREVAPADGAAERPGVELLVTAGNLQLAQRLIYLYQSGKSYCPRCGSLSVRHLPAAWYWYILAVIFVMMPPYWPPANMCESCGLKWG